MHQSIFNQLEEGKDVRHIIQELRAGGIDFDTAFQIALTATIAYMMYINRVEGFQTVHHYPPRIGERGNVNNGGRPPHAGGYGKGAGPRSITVTGATNSGSEKNILQNAYNQIPSLSVEGTDLKVTAWSVAKHAHHAPDFGLDPTQYGMTQADLDSIAENGLIKHINQNGTPPSSAFVKVLQKRWKAFAEHETVRDCGIQFVMSEDF